MSIAEYIRFEGRQIAEIEAFLGRSAQAPPEPGAGKETDA
jgi:hypothetical protein